MNVFSTRGVARAASLGSLLLASAGCSGNTLQPKPPFFVKTLFPRPIGDSAPRLANEEIETGVGLTWMPDPSGDRNQGVLGPNVIGHGAASGTMWRIALDHELVIVVGRTQFEDWSENEKWMAKFAAAVADGLAE